MDRLAEVNKGKRDQYLAGRWLIDGSVRDYSGRGHHATRSGVTSVSSVRGQVWELNGTTDQGGIADAVPLRLTTTHNQKTISVWFKASDTTGIQTILSKWGDISTRREWIIYLNGTALTLGANKQSVEVTHTISAGRWYQVTATLDGYSSATMYVDGDSKGSGAQIALQTAVEDIGIGHNGGNNNFAGQIGEVIMHNRLATASEVWEQYVVAKDVFKRRRRRVFSVSPAPVGGNVLAGPLSGPFGSPLVGPFG